MKLMSNMKKMLLVFALTLGMSLSLVSAKPRQVNSQPVQATAVVEVQTVGGEGDGCGAALGVAAGLAIGALSPCSIICAVGAWYIGIGGAALLC